MNSVIVIPARLHSTRLPRKMLISETGKPLIQHTYEAASQSTLAQAVIVATDSAEIKTAVETFGGMVVMTDPGHQSGTDRVAEVASRFSQLGLPQFDLIVNVQGDEPNIRPSAIDDVIRLLISHPDAAVATLATPIRDAERLASASCVKVVFDEKGRAMYFSRSPIPMPRDLSQMEQLLAADPASFYQHVGVYGFRYEFLLKIPGMTPTQIEKIEMLEQLRFLDAGWPVFVGIIDGSPSGIDTPEDYALFVNRQVN